MSNASVDSGTCPSAGSHTFSLQVSARASSACRPSRVRLFLTRLPSAPPPHPPTLPGVGDVKDLMRLDSLPPPPGVHAGDYDLGNSRNSSGWGALHRAASRGQTEACKYLLNAAYHPIKSGTGANRVLKIRPPNFKPHWIHMRTAFGIRQKEIKIGDPKSVSLGKSLHLPLLLLPPRCKQ